MLDPQVKRAKLLLKRTSSDLRQASDELVEEGPPPEGQAPADLEDLGERVTKYLTDSGAVRLPTGAAMTRLRADTTKRLNSSTARSRLAEKTL